MHSRVHNLYLLITKYATSKIWILRNFFDSNSLTPLPLDCISFLLYWIDLPISWTLTNWILTKFTNSAMFHYLPHPSNISTLLLVIHLKYKPIPPWPKPPTSLAWTKGIHITTLLLSLFLPYDQFSIVFRVIFKKPTSAVIPRLRSCIWRPMSLE